MGRLNNDDQFKFLISCIRWSNNGKVDFSEVAKECKIVTKGAAAKRYERMMKAHGIHQPSSSRDTIVPPLRRKEDIGTPPSKKRKQDQFSSDCSAAVDDDETPGRIKDEVAYPGQGTAPVKDEHPLHDGTQAGTNYPWLYRAPQSDPSLNDDNAFDDFIVSGAFESINPQHGYGQAIIQQNNEDEGTLTGSDGAQDNVLILD